MIILIAELAGGKGQFGVRFRVAEGDAQGMQVETGGRRAAVQAVTKDGTS